MPRQVNESRIQTRSARAKLEPRSKPYYREISDGLHLGYRKGARKGSWVARFYDGNGAYSVETIGTADDHANEEADGVLVLNYYQAERAARDRRKARVLGETTGEASGAAYTVADACDDYLKHVRLHARPASVAGIEQTIRVFIRPALGDVDTAKLTTQRIVKWQTELAETPPRLRTKDGKEQRFREEAEGDDPEEAARKRKLGANRKLVVLKAALNFAWKNGRIASNTAWARVKPFRAVEKPRKRYLTPAECRRLLNACEPDLRDLVRAALLTGCRYGELCRLDVGDFDPGTGLLHITRSKSGKARHIVLTDEGAEFFKQLAIGREPDAPLLRKADGSRWGRWHNVRPFKSAVERAKLDPATVFHELRHTYASLSIMAGAPLMVVAEQLGHADTRMVERTYGHLAKSYVAETIRATAPSFGDVAETNVRSINDGA